MREIKVFNTMTEKKEILSPKENEIRMYVCGVTAYDLCHIGHARSAMVFDIVYRFLKEMGFSVRYVRNFTDIDDKIINRAKELGWDWKRVSEFYMEKAKEDMEKLGILPPTVEPKATDHIEDMIELIKILIDKGYAYSVDGDVFFEVEKFKDYGKLSKRNKEEMKAGARIEIDERKKNPLDFSLWKAKKEGEPFWESPFGLGRPGWHIECSAMSMRYLGPSFDIHGGGKDLIFPHHENEIAQSEAATGVEFARYWIHNGFVTVSGEKMSKSLGNFYTIRDIFKECHPEALRIFFLKTHYRNPIDFSKKALSSAKKDLERIYTFLKETKELKGDPEKELKDRAISSFLDAMCDDFNTAKAFGILNNLLREGNRLLSSFRDRLDETILTKILAKREALVYMGKVFGIGQLDPDTYFSYEKKRVLEKVGITEEEIEELVKKRDEARRKRDFSLADSIREKLKSMGVSLKDTKEGTIWKIED